MLKTSICRFMSYVFIVSFLIGISLSSWASAPPTVFRLDIDGLSSQQITQAQKLLFEVERRLPPSMRRILNSPLLIHFAPLIHRNERIAGTTFILSKEITLKKSLLDQMGDEGESAPVVGLASHHKTYFDLALATLIHEFSHLFDHQVKVSDQAEFLNLLNWNSTGFPFAYRSQTNQKSSRTVDPYELTSPKEAFAIEMEYFILDPEHSCRSPGVHVFLEKFLNYDPFPGYPCARSGDVATAQGKIVDLNSLKLYQVHLLTASNGQGLTSGWGHTMIRLVFCAPEHQLGPECLGDIQYQEVLAFSALVNDADISKWDGLTGKYPSVLQIIPLSSVISQYNDLELRDLRSVPLNLTELQMQQFIDSALEVYWTYRGKYFFLGNNCATEALNLLKKAVPDNELLQALYTYTPTGLEKKLGKIGFANPNVLQEQALAQALGYVFKSAKATYLLAFQSIEKQFPNFAYENLLSYLNSKASDRALLIQQATMLTSPSRQTTGAAMLLLETLIKGRTRMGLQFVAFKRAFDSSKEGGQAQADFQRLTHLSPTSDSLATDDEYGIPTNAEVEESAVALKAEMHENVTELNLLIQKLISENTTDEEKNEVALIHHNFNQLETLIQN